jgi:hypothetical protein
MYALKAVFCSEIYLQRLLPNLTSYKISDHRQKKYRTLVVLGTGTVTLIKKKTVSHT